MHIDHCKNICVVSVHFVDSLYLCNDRKGLFITARDWDLDMVIKHKGCTNGKINQASNNFMSNALK